MRMRLADDEMTGTMAAAFVSLALGSARSGDPVIVLTAVPVLVLNNAYRRANLQYANCAAGVRS